jgi:hypothetical protein
MDVTIPFTTRRHLPVVALTEMFSSGEGGRAPLRVEIEIAQFETHWEQHKTAVPSAKIPALFMDTFTFFDSGHVIYAPTFLLLMSEVKISGRAPTGNEASQLLSALTSLVGSPGGSYVKGLDNIRSNIFFRSEGQTSGAGLPAFINDRLSTLRKRSGSKNLFTDLIHPSLKESGWDDQQCSEACAGITEATWDDLRSASIEVVSANLYNDIVGWCHAAKAGAMKVGDSERALAALAQNILDITNQDDHEVIDSLSQSVVLNEHVLLIHPKLALRYSHRGRSFSEMRNTIAGCPYFLLTNVVVAYNEYLLEQNARFVDQIKTSIRIPGWVEGLSGSNMNADLTARSQLFENHTLNVLPNIFRYPTERVMFEGLVSQRGLDQRADGIERFTDHLYQLRKDSFDLDERKSGRRTNGLLLALGVFQVSGLLLAALSLKEFESAPAAFSSYLTRPTLWIIFGISLGIGLIVGLRALSRR